MGPLSGIVYKLKKIVYHVSVHDSAKYKNVNLDDSHFLYRIIVVIKNVTLKFPKKRMITFSTLYK